MVLWPTEQARLVAMKPASMTYEEASAGAATVGLLAPSILMRGHIPGETQALICGADVTGVCSAETVQMVKTLGTADVVGYTIDVFTRSGAEYDIVFGAAGTCHLRGA